MNTDKQTKIEPIEEEAVKEETAVEETSLTQTTTEKPKGGTSNDGTPMY